METETNAESKVIIPRKIAARIKDNLNLTISIRHIRRIINGITPDTYGIINEALRIAREEKKNLEKQREKLALLRN
jgi:hypothetical protein